MTKQKEGTALGISTQARFHRWWPLLLLVIGGGLRWLVLTARPDAGSSPLSECLGCLWAALLMVALLRRAPTRLALRRSWQSMLAGAMLIGGPLLVLVVPAPRMEGAALAMTLTLTAIVIAVAGAALGSGSSDGVVGKLWPGLAAVGGLLLVLAEPSLSDVRSDLLLIAAPILAGVGASLFAREKTPGTWKLSATLIGATLLFFVATLFHHDVHALRQPATLLVAIASDGLMALLSVLALERLGPTRWSAQFVVVPLLVLLEGIAMVRPPLTARWFVGMALLAVAGLYLLIPDHDESGEQHS